MIVICKVCLSDFNFHSVNIQNYLVFPGGANGGWVGGGVYSGAVGVCLN